MPTQQKITDSPGGVCCCTSSKVRSKKELTAKLGILSLLHTTTLNGSVVPTIEFSVVLLELEPSPGPCNKLASKATSQSHLDI